MVAKLTLTDLEKRILVLVWEEKSNAVIAEAVGLSESALQKNLDKLHLRVDLGETRTRHARPRRRAPELPGVVLLRRVLNGPALGELARALGVDARSLRTNLEQVVAEVSAPQQPRRPVRTA